MCVIDYETEFKNSPSFKIVLKPTHKSVDNVAKKLYENVPAEVIAAAAKKTNYAGSSEVCSSEEYQTQ